MGGIEFVLRFFRTRLKSPTITNRNSTLKTPFVVNFPLAGSGSTGKKSVGKILSLQQISMIISTRCNTCQYCIYACGSFLSYTPDIKRQTIMVISAQKAATTSALCSSPPRLFTRDLLQSRPAVICLHY